MAFKELLSGEDLITRHTDTIRELPTKGLKEYCPNNSWLEKKQIEIQLSDNYDFLKCPIIEISKELSQAEWIPDLKKAKVTKRCGKLWETLGHHQDNEDWLLPEEVLFLIESGELQLIWDSVCLSLEDCYSLIFSDCDCSEDEFKVFSYLTRTGMKVMRHSPSVSATHYEKQVRLDTVIQKQKRTPPRQVVEDDITVIEDDDCTVVTPVSNSNDTTNKQSSNSNTESMDVIEIEDDQVIESDSDSDIICISSPTSSDVSRNWYPPIEKCLQRRLEKLIDLCVESDESNDEEKFSSKVNLLNKSRDDILSLIPSAINGTSSIKVPENSLLPPNIVPRYAEYKVSLNIKTDNSESQRNNIHHDFLLDRTHMSSVNNLMDFNNPLLKKAQEIQVMALTMMQTASKLMSAANSNNQTPNDHSNWQLKTSTGRDMVNFNPQNVGPRNLNSQNFNSENVNPRNLNSENVNPRNLNSQNFNPRSGIGLSHPRHFWPQGRPYGFRFPNRRRGPYRRNNSSWAERKPHFNNSSSNVGRGRRHFQKPNHIVIISDEDDLDDEISSENTVNNEIPQEKRKWEEGDEDVNKRFKPGAIKEEDKQDTELFNSEIKKESESSGIATNEKERDLKVKEEFSPPSANKMETDIKDASTNSVVKKESNEDKERVELVISSVKSEKDLPNRPIDKNINEIENTNNSLEKKINDIEDSQISTDSTDSTRKDSNGKHIEENVIEMKESTPISNECTREETIKLKIGGHEASSSLNESVRPVEASTDGNQDYEQINSWGEYKSLANECEDEEEDIFFNLEQCETYDNVLSTLQIFKKININKGNKKYKISFDAYLPESNFKKSLKILPNYRVIVLKSFDEIPFPFDIDGLKIEYQDNIPFLFSIVSDDTISFYLCDNVSLNTYYN